MTNNRPAAVYLLNGQIEVHARRPSDNTQHRAISFDKGATWNSWAKLPDLTNHAPAVAATAEGKTRYRVYQSTLAPLNKQFILNLTDMFGYDNGTASPLGGAFKFGPSVVCSPDGNTVIVFGNGMDDRFFWAGSRDRAQSWQWVWPAMGEGTFKSAPAAVASGNTMMVFGIGMDNRCWYARSVDGGNSWNPFWGPIGSEVFTSAPAACLSADGKVAVVAARGNDNKCWFNRSTNGGASWNAHFEPLLAGVFNSGPALCGSWDMQHVHAFGLGMDKKIWRAESANWGGAWVGWSAIPGSINF